MNSILYRLIHGKVGNLTNELAIADLCLSNLVVLGIKFHCLQEGDDVWVFTTQRPICLSKLLNREGNIHVCRYER